jgi:hypothetical protein
METGSTFEVTAGAETAFAAGQHQPASQVFDELGQAFHLQAAEVGGGDIFQHDGPIAVEAFGGEGMRLRGSHIHGETAGAQCADEVVFFAVAVQHEQSRTRIDAHDPFAPVVLAERVVVHIEPHLVGVQAPLFQQVAEQQAVHSGGEMARFPVLHDRLAVAVDGDFAVGLAVGIDPDGVLKRLARKHGFRQHQRFDGDVAGANAREFAVVDRHAEFERAARRRQGGAAVRFAVGKHQNAGRAVSVDEIESGVQCIGQVAAVGENRLFEFGEDGVFGKRILDRRRVAERDQRHTVAVFSVVLQIEQQFFDALFGVLGHRAGPVGHDDDVDPFAAEIHLRPGQGRQQHGEREQAQYAGDSRRTSPPPIREP